MDDFVKKIIFVFMVLASTSVLASERVLQVTNLPGLFDAINQTSDASFNSRYVIKVAPGVYFLSGQQIELKPYVRLQGSGIHQTTIQSARFSEFSSGSRLDACVVKGGEATSISDMTIRNFGSNDVRDMACGVGGISNISDTTIEVRGRAQEMFGSIGGSFDGVDITVNNSLSHPAQAWGIHAFAINNPIVKDSTVFVLSLIHI